MIKVIFLLQQYGVLFLASYLYVHFYVEMNHGVNKELQEHFNMHQVQILVIINNLINLNHMLCLLHKEREKYNYYVEE
jgi:hypothetical protein